MKLLQKHKNLIPLLILAGICLYTFFYILFGRGYHQGEYYDMMFSLQHYLAFAAVTLNIIVYFFFRRIFKFTLVGMLLLGLLNIINFTPNGFRVGVAIQDQFLIEIQPFSLLFIIVFYLPNREKIHKYVRKHLLHAPNPKKQAEASRERVAKFKAAFAKKPDASLLEMMQSQVIVPDASEAARQLLQERGAQLF